MSYRIKIPPKTLPVDEAHLLGGMDRLVVALERHRAALLGALAVIVAAAAVIGGVVWFDFRSTEAAEQLQHQAMVLLQDRPADNAGKADDNLKRAIALLRQVVDQHGRTRVAEQAMFELGNALMLAKDTDGAIDAYTRFIAGYGANKLLLGMVYQRLGYAYLLKGDADQAAKAWSAAVEVPGALNKDQALFELGKLEESQSRPEGALARYQDLMKTYPNSPFTGEAAVRIKALEAKKSPPDAGSAPSAESKPQASSEGTPKPPSK